MALVARDYPLLTHFLQMISGGGWSYTTFTRNLMVTQFIDLQKVPQINRYLDPFGVLSNCSLVHEVIIRDDVKALDILLHFDPNIDSFSGFNATLTPFQLAIVIHQNHFIQPLLRSRSDIFIRNNEGHNALDLAVISDNIQCISLLAPFKARFTEEARSSSLTISDYLMLFCRKSDLDGVSFLVKSGYNLGSELHVNGITYILEKLNVNHVLNISVIKELVEYSRQRFNCDLLSTKNKTTGDTFLHFAVKQNNVLLVNLLISLGMDVNATNAQRETPLFTLLFEQPLSNEIPILRILLTNGAGITRKNVSGSCPIVLCFSRKRVDLFFEMKNSRPNDELILKTDAIVRRFLSKNNKTLLNNQTLLDDQYTEITTTLVTETQSPAIPVDGKKAQNDLKASGGQLLPGGSLGTDSSASLMSLLKGGSISGHELTLTITQMIEKGKSSLTAMDADFNRPVHLAIMRNCSVEVITRLLEPYITPNQINRANQSPLTLALTHYKLQDHKAREALVKLLLDRKADPGVKQGTKSTLIMAKECDSSLLIVEMLLKHEGDGKPPTKLVLEEADIEAAFGWNIEVLEMVLRHVFPQTTPRAKESWTESGLFLVLNNFLKEGKEAACLRVVKQLIEDFKVDVNLIRNGESILQLLIKYSDTCQVMPLIDYLLSLETTDVSLRHLTIEGEPATPLGLAFNLAKYEIASKLIARGSDVLQNDHKLLKFEPGFSLPLLELFKQGFVFTQLSLKRQPQYSEEVAAEWKWFKNIYLLEIESFVYFDAHSDAKDKSYVKLSWS